MDGSLHLWFVLDADLKTTSVSQSKDIIKRTNGTFQERLVQKLKIKGITNINKTNEYLINTNCKIESHKYFKVKSIFNKHNY